MSSKSYIIFNKFLRDFSKKLWHRKLEENNLLPTQRLIRVTSAAPMYPQYLTEAV